MSQAALWGVPPTPPAPPTTFAARLNDSLNALRSSHKGAAFPTYGEDGTLWLDTSADPIWHIRMRLNDVNVSLGAFTKTTGLFLPTLADLTSIRNALFPPGFGPLPWHLVNAPAGWIFAFGQGITSTWPAYRAALLADGAPHGMSGSDPKTIDMRGVSPTGLDDLGGTPRGLITLVGSVLGAAFGSQITTQTLPQVPAHDQGGLTGTRATGAQSRYRGGLTTVNQYDGSAAITGQIPNVWVGAAGSDALADLAETPHDHVIGSQGSGAPMANLGPRVFTKWIVKAH